MNSTNTQARLNASTTGVDFALVRDELKGGSMAPIQNILKIYKTNSEPFQSATHYLDLRAGKNPRRPQNAEGEKKTFSQLLKKTINPI